MVQLQSANTGMIAHFRSNATGWVAWAADLSKYDLPSARSGDSRSGRIIWFEYRSVPEGTGERKVMVG